eukprot:106257-Hanusia_phi.AAC.1
MRESWRILKEAGGGRKGCCWRGGGGATRSLTLAQLPAASSHRREGRKASQPSQRCEDAS